MKRYIVELLEGADVVDKMELVAESWLDARKLAVREAAADVHRPKWPSDPMHRDIRAATVAEAKRLDEARRVTSDDQTSPREEGRALVTPDPLSRANPTPAREGEEAGNLVSADAKETTCSKPSDGSVSASSGPECFSSDTSGGSAARKAEADFDRARKFFRCYEAFDPNGRGQASYPTHAQLDALTRDLAAQFAAVREEDRRERAIPAVHPSHLKTAFDVLDDNLAELREAVRSLLAAEERGQGVPWREAIDRLAKLVGKEP